MVGAVLSDLPQDVLLVIALHLTGNSFRAFTATCRTTRFLWTLATGMAGFTSNRQKQQLRERAINFLEHCGAKLCRKMAYDLQVSVLQLALATTGASSKATLGSGDVQLEVTKSDWHSRLNDTITLEIHLPEDMAWVARAGEVQQQDAFRGTRIRDGFSRP